MLFYTGIGSRRTPDKVLAVIGHTAKKLSELGFTLRTGDAKGADREFFIHSEEAQVFKSKDAVMWAYAEVRKHIPTDRHDFDEWTPYVQGLLARNMMQVLGQNEDEPSKFVLCYAPSLTYTDSSAGGTGYAIRCALAHHIPVYNMFDLEVLKAIVRFAVDGTEFWT